MRVSVTEHKKKRTGADSVVRLATHRLKSSSQPVGTLFDTVEPAQGVCRCASILQLEVADFGQLVIVNDGEIEGDLRRVLRSRVQEVALWSKSARHGGHNFFADRIQGRVRHLSKLLREVIKKQPGAVRDCRDWRIGAHGAQRLGSILAHRTQQHPHFFLGVAEGPLTTLNRAGGMDNVLALGELSKFDAVILDPFTPGLFVGKLLFKFLVFDEPTFYGVRQQHGAWTQPTLAHHR